VDGILVQLPLPAGIASHAILSAIDPKKDVDGFLKENMGLLALGEFSGALPCTPYGVMVLLAAYGIPLAGRRAVVVGRSNIVGKPMSLLLLSENSTVTVAHSRTRDLASVTREADILIAAAGQPKLLTKEHVKEGAVVVDVGMHRGSDGKLCGDVDASLGSGVAGHASALTPVPGGVGPMTIAMLLVNTAATAWE
jgi:methylenetetrahydrofolate dehydrogenase (NADP+) / methenyltetrahydrofolate cyclohydrolase